MIGNVLFSIGSLCFAILLVIVYFIKAKQTNINNKIYKLALVTLIAVIVTELITIPILYYHKENVALGNFWARVNAFCTITWVMLMCWYLITLGRGYKVTNLKDSFMNDRRLRIIMEAYIILLITSLFFKFENVSTNEGAYISGPALYFLYIAGIIAVLISSLLLLQNKKELSKFRKGPVLIGVIETILSMIIQVIYPMNLIITGSFVFKMYLIYFMFENPDLYLAEELENAKKKADDSNKSKTDFLSNMSHEIRTPMNAIMGFSEGILNEKTFTPENAKKDIAHIYTAGTNLLEIINNILDISKIETGEEKVELRDYSIGSIVLELKSIIEARINKERIKFITDIDPKIPKQLLGDKTKLFQVLLNILSNSVKYTEVGRISLTISADISGSNANLHFKISDTGYGIKKEDYQKLFEKFSRLETATKNEIEGTGLGLVITKRLVDLMGGKIWFESEYGAGTTFYVELSQKIVNKEPIGNILIENSIKHGHTYIDCSNYKILLVDDNKLNLKVAEKVLEPYKFKITTLDNGKDCVDLIKEGAEFDMIFLDHMMPRMDGIEVLHILHKLDGYSIPPVVALTANAITGMREMYLKEGFDEYLSKPINTGDLDKLVKKYFGHGPSRTEINLTEPAKEEKKEAPKVAKITYLENNGFDINEALTYVKDMSSFNEFLEGLYYDLDNQLDGLKKALAKENIKKYGVLAHGLKSNYRSFGMKEFADLAYKHEQEAKNNNLEYLKNHYQELSDSKDKAKAIISKYLEL